MILNKSRRERKLEKCKIHRREREKAGNVLWMWEGQGYLGLPPVPHAFSHDLAQIIHSSIVEEPLEMFLP